MAQAGIGDFNGGGIGPLEDEHKIGRTFGSTKTSKPGACCSLVVQRSVLSACPEPDHHASIFTLRWLTEKIDLGLGLMITVGGCLRWAMHQAVAAKC